MKKPAVESEVKLRVDSAAAAQELLARAGAALVAPRHLERNQVYDDARFGLRARGETLRLRRTPQGATLTFKGARRMIEGVKTREERESAVADPDAVEALLVALGFAVVFRYEKYRETWSVGATEVVVDETPIGTFIEVEGEVPAIHAVAGRLGFSPGEYLSESYVALFFASGGQGDMTFGKG